MAAIKEKRAMQQFSRCLSGLKRGRHELFYEIATRPASYHNRLSGSASLDQFRRPTQQSNVGLLERGRARASPVTVGMGKSRAATIC